MSILETPLSQLPSTSVLTLKKFTSLGITTFHDLLEYYPLRHEDRSIIASIGTLQEGEIVTIIGTIRSFKTKYVRSRMTIQQAELVDSTGSIEVVWFNQRYLATVLADGVRVALYGEVKKKGAKLTLMPREFEVLKTENQQMVHMGRVVPVYPERRGLSSKTIREKMAFILHALEQVPEDEIEFLPEGLRTNFNLADMKQSYHDIHIPSDITRFERAKRRLSFNELFIIQMCAHLVREQWSKEKTGTKFVLTKYDSAIQSFIAHLPFSLTNAQKNVVEAIFNDLTQPFAMNRFVQGDVGSGKTVVAALACYVAHLNGHKSLFMAPTEILAQQHFATLELMFKNTEVKIGIKTGSRKMSSDAALLDTFDVVVGTHALLSEKLNMKKVGLVVIDEQHRFGVRQRALIQKKGFHPHLLTMTATPIPRTVALTLFSELDMSVINEMPKDRLAVKSFLVPKTKRQSAYDWIKKQIAAGHQAFIICPLIEESEHETLKAVRAASKEVEYLKTTIFPDLRLGLMHGKLKADEKAAMMNSFKNKEIDILVSTSVVEVGIDIPNATVIVIEASERFGLAQLHQLRGRVGRSSTQSYCLLFTESDSVETTSRLTYFASHPLGIDIAQFDLDHRGPGQLYGTQQHGYVDLKIASLADPIFIEFVKKAVEEFVHTYSLADFPILKKQVDTFRVAEIAQD